MPVSATMFLANKRSEGYSWRMPIFRNRTYAAFLFDLDGTIVDSSEVVELVWRAWAERTGADAEALLAACHGVRGAELLQRFGGPDLNIAEEVAWLDKAGDEHAHKVGPIKGVETFLARVEPDQWAVVTSAPRALAELRLRTVGVAPPATIVSADDVTHGKPNPEGFLKAARALGVAIEDCLIFEDSPAGVEAAKASGAHVAIVGGLVAPSEGTYAIADYL